VATRRTRASAVSRPLGPERTLVRSVMTYEPHGSVEGVADALGILSFSMQNSVKGFKKYIESRDVEDGGWRGQVHDSVADPLLRR